MTRIAAVARDIDRAVASPPPVLRYALRCAAACGVVGGVVGLVIGLRVHPATAWFAVAEVGVPATILGLPLGAAAGLVREAWVRRSWPRR